MMGGVVDVGAALCGRPAGHGTGPRPTPQGTHPGVPLLLLIISELP